MQRLEFPARLDAELLDEHAARTLVDVEGFRLTTGAIERKHQMSP